MRAYVIRSPRLLSPFGERAAELPIGGEKLGELQRRLFARFGLLPCPVDQESDIPAGEAALVTYDDVYFTRRVLKSFLQRWRAGGCARTVRAALPASSTFVQSFSALQGWREHGAQVSADLYGLKAGERFQAQQEAEPLPVIYKEIRLRYPMPQATLGMNELAHPITSSVILHVRHWLHLLQANRLSIQIRWVDEVLAHPLWTAGVLARAVVPARGRLLWRVLARANRKGRNVDVHPTARLEGCFLGDGVQVGAQALLRGAIIGAGTRVEERANITNSVIGERCFVSKSATIYGCASMEGSHLAMAGMQFCLVGRGVGLGPRATPLDALLGRRISVKVDGGYAEIDFPLLGSCFGHQSLLGADVYVAPGREIPNGVRVLPVPERVLASIPEGAAPGTYIVRDGKLTPV